MAFLNHMNFCLRTFIQWVIKVLKRFNWKVAVRFCLFWRGSTVQHVYYVRVKSWIFFAENLRLVLQGWYGSGDQVKGHNLGQTHKKKHVCLAILLVTFLGWWKRDPFKGCWWPPTIGDKKVTLNQLVRNFFPTGCHNQFWHVSLWIFLCWKSNVDRSPFWRKNVKFVTYVPPPLQGVFRRGWCWQKPSLKHPS